MAPRSLITGLASLALVSLLAACATPGANAPTAEVLSPTTTAAPTEAPTIVPTAAPTIAPTAPAAALPSGLYVLQSGQIFRFEADGAARTQITYEVPYSPEIIPVTDFAVSPTDSRLIYTVQRQNTQVLVRSGADGENPAPIFDDAKVSANDPLFAPDGRSVVVRLQGPFDDPNSFQSGLYRIPIDGGAPQLLLADDSIPDLNSVSDAAGSMASAFSPDGARLLVHRFGLQLETCSLAIFSLADGAITPVQAPAPPPMERQTTCTSSASWAPDSSAVYFTVVRIGAPAGETTIWRADPATGASEPITPEQQSAPFTLYYGPSVASDGSILALSTEVEALPEPFAESSPIFSYSLVRVDPTTGETSKVRPAGAFSPSLPVWDKAGAGVALVDFDVATGRSRVLWVPAGEGPPLELEADASDVYALVWATP